MMLATTIGRTQSDLGFCVKAAMATGFALCVAGIAYLGSVPVHAAIGGIAASGTLLALLAGLGRKRHWHVLLGRVSVGMLVGCDLAGIVAHQRGASVSPLHAVIGLLMTLVAAALVFANTGIKAHRSLGTLLGLAFLVVFMASRFT